MAFRPRTKEDYLDLFSRIFPRSYVAPLESELDGVGLDVPSAYAAMFARVSAAVNNSQQSFFLREHSIQTGPVASGQTYARGRAEITRLAPADWDLVIPAGTELLAVIDDSYGLRMQVGVAKTVNTIAIVAGELSGTVDIVSAYPGYQGNMLAGWVSEFYPVGDASIPVITTTLGCAPRSVAAVAGDTFVDSFIGRYVRLSEQPWGGTVSSATSLRPRRIESITRNSSGIITSVEFDVPVDSTDVGKILLCEVEEMSSLGVSVTGTEMTGGTDDSLGAIGNDRDIVRSLGESDEAFSDRIQQMPDTVSPNAIDRICKRVLANSGIRYRIIETRDTSTLGGFVWDLCAYDTGTLQYDDGAPIQGGVMLGDGTLRRFFVVLVSEPAVTSSESLVFDYGAFDDLPYDTVSTVDSEYMSYIHRLWNEINDARAAGVGFIIMKDSGL